MTASAQRPIERPDGAGPMGHAATDVAEAARARLLAAVETAQGAMGDVVDAAAVYDALLPAGDAERVDGGTLLAHLSARVAGAQYGPGHRLVGHLRYFRGQRFLDEPGGLLADVPRPREHPVTDRPP